MPDDPQIMLTVQVDRYLAEADALKYGDPVLLLERAQMATTHAQTLGDFWRYGRALVHQAWAYSFLSRYESALTRALEVLELAREYHLVDIEAQAVGTIALCFLKCGILQEAAYLFEHERMLGEQLQDQALQAMAINDLAVVKMEMGDYEAAVTLLRQAVTLMPSDTHAGLDNSITHLNLAFACVKTQRFDEAVHHAQQVLARVQDSPKHISDAHLWIASAHLGWGQPDAARERIAQARACVENAEPPIYNDNVEQLTAEWLTAEGRHAEAVRVWESMYEMAIERRELDYAISALNYLKAAYRRAGDAAGEISAYQRLSEDIPARQQQTSDLRFTVLRMVFARDKAALQAELRLSQQKSAMLTRLSHEFRTPLAIIQSSSNMLERYADKLTLEQRQARLQRISAQVQWMTVMLDDILEILRLDEGHEALLEQSTFTLEELAQTALQQMDRYRVSNLHVRVEVQPDTGRIHAPGEALQTVLAHLLTNAVKFSYGEVRLELRVSDGVLFMRVSDQGIGIPLAEQSDIFKPLVRGSNLDEVTGSGLGLAIVDKLVRRMNGTIELASTVGRGTIITVTVPLV